MAQWAEYKDTTNPTNEMEYTGNAEHDKNVEYYVRTGQAKLKDPNQVRPPPNTPAPDTRPTVPEPTPQPKVAEETSSTLPPPDESTSTPTSTPMTSAEADRVEAAKDAGSEYVPSTNTTSLSGVEDASKAKPGAKVETINEASTIPEYTVTPNQLHEYASYTYSLSLHALTPDDYSAIIENPRIDYIPKAVLIASAGRYPKERHKEFAGVDFFFDNLVIETVIGMTAQTRNTNAISCSFTIIEPYGVTLLNRIMNVSTDIGGQNFREMPYLLQIDFFGYKDDGVPTKIPGISKMIPIRFGEFKIKLSTKGAEYAITAFPFNHIAFAETIASTPTKLEVVAPTVGDFFLSKTGVSEEMKKADTQRVKDNVNNAARKDIVDREVAMAEKARTAQQKADGTRGPPAKSQVQIELENEQKVLSTSVSNALVRVHSYTGAVNAWWEALRDENKIEYPNVIEFEIDPEIAKASFPGENVLPPADMPMQQTKTDADKTATDVLLAKNFTYVSQVNTSSIDGITAASSNDIQNRPEGQARTAPALANTANTKTTAATTPVIYARPQDDPNFDASAYGTDPVGYTAKWKEENAVKQAAIDQAAGDAAYAKATESQRVAAATDIVKGKEKTQNGWYTKCYEGDARTRIMSINQGTSIVEVVGLALRSSSFITGQIQDPLTSSATPDELAKLAKTALKWFKITPRVKLKQFDHTQNSFAKVITYKIEIFTVYNTKNRLAPQGEPKGYVKDYQYMYTGQNNDIVNLDINFDSLYYVAQTTAAVNRESTSGAQDTKDDADIKAQESSIKAAEQKALRDSKANYGYQPTFSNVNSTVGLASLTSKDDQAKQLHQQLLTSPSGDMLSIKLKIVGDPDFIKQDDCFYSTPTLTAMKEANYKLPNGSIVMDLGEIFVNLTFKTPGDYSEEGIAYPGYANYNSSIFSGRYKVLTVKNTFSGGKFEQELDLVYYPNQPTQGLNAPVKATDSKERSTGDYRPGDTRTASDDTSSPLLADSAKTDGTKMLNDFRSPEESPSPRPPEIEWGDGEPDLTERITAVRKLATTYPTLHIGEDSIQRQMSATQVGLTPTLDNLLGKVPSTIPTMPMLKDASSQLTSSLASAQSAASTALGNVQATLKVPTPPASGTGGQF